MKKENPEVKALVTTAYANAEVQSGMTRGELHGLFIKPYSIDRFLARVSELVRANQRRHVIQSEALIRPGSSSSNREISLKLKTRSTSDLLSAFKSELLKQLIWIVELTKWMY